jgi:hypothetical protein
MQFIFSNGLLFILCIVTLIHSQGTDFLSQALYYQSKGFVALNGEQSGIYDPVKYILIGNVVISPESEVVFMPGAVIYSKAGNRITVGGKLTCNGTKELPVKFLIAPDSLDYSSDSITPIWRGIAITDTGSFSATYTTINNADTAVMLSTSYRSLQLTNVKFGSANKNQITINEQTTIFPVNSFITLNSENGMIPQLPVSLKEIKNDPKDSYSNVNGQRWGATVTFGCAAVVFLGGALISEYFRQKYFDKAFYNLTNGDIGEHDAKKSDYYCNLRNGLFAASGVSLGFSVAFVFPNIIKGRK